MNKNIGNAISIIILTIAATAIAACGSADPVPAAWQNNQNIEVSKYRVEIPENHEQPYDDVNEEENMDPAENRIPEADLDKRIVCWGDSLTEGTGGEGVSYPGVLAELSGCEVLNYGVYGENSSLIAARQGGKPSHVENLEEMPASTTQVPVSIVDDDGTWEMWCNFGDAGINPCRIAGIEGTLSIDTNDGTRYFTRLEAGEAVKLGNDNKFYTHAMMDSNPEDILVIWSGSSDRWDENPDIDKIICNINSMLNYSGCKEYLVIGYTVSDGFEDPSVPKMWNERLGAEYDDKFLDIKKYIVGHGLEDAGITPTQQDIGDMNNGEIPTSLLSDEAHGNAAFYTIVGEQVYAKMCELGYFNK